MTNYNDGNWWGYNGQDVSSVHSLSEIEAVWLGACSAGMGQRKKGEHVWAGTVAFRVTKEHREPREWWADPETGQLCKSSYGRFTVKVREVLDE